MKDFFKDLFEYNYVSNDKIIEIYLNHANQFPEKSISLLSHILNAQQVWNSRILNLKSSFTVWGIHPAKELKSINLNNKAQSIEIIDRLDLTLDLNYQTSTGMAFSNNISDILFHIINHSTYHRGQIMSDLKMNGIEPASTDFIFYKR